ncbi:MAG: 3-hydroxyacyl-CoA dehydrogenase NAD-binding domain-containing protein [Pseudomonadota bacterium]
MNAVTYRVDDQIGILSISNPPVNALSQKVREGIVAALRLAADDDSIATILICEGRTFIAGADITEFGKPPKDPALAEVLLAMEAHPKLLLSAIHGTALGGGLETALCCHYRCAVADAKLGLPEVKLGLLPGAGGTQRSPRLVGTEMAIQLMTLGNPISAEQALKVGLIDTVFVGDLLGGAKGYARSLAENSASLRRVRDIAYELTEEDRELIAATRKTLAKKTRGENAPQRILDCIEAAATLNFDAGLALERERFVECMEDPQSAALRHMFFAERQATKVADLDPEAEIKEVNTVGIIGAGTMGGGIAMSFAEAGFDVTLLDMDQEAVDRGLAKIDQNYSISIKRGRFSDETVTTIRARITGATDYKALAKTDLVIEAVFENLAVKREVFTSLDGIAKSGAILASNTSYQSIDDIAAATTRPESVVGMHFFSPANVMKLLEVVRGQQTSDSVIATAMNIGKRIRKVPVLSGMCYGFIGNRMLRPYGREAALCLIEGASPAQIDSVMQEWGMAMGPLAVSDLAGLDIGYKAREQLSDEEKGPKAAYLIADRLVEAGRLGQKSGLGYYRYDPDTRARIDDPDVMDIVSTAAADLGIKRRSIDDQEILDRLLLALANEGARVLGEGIAQRSSDIDVVYCYGYGFPRFRGGPMHVIESQGLATVVEKIEAYAQSLDPALWQVAPLLKELAEGGGSLSSWKPDY